MKRLLLILICSFAGLTSAQAQELNLAGITTSRPHIVHLSTGLEHAFTATAGYDYVVSLADRLFLAGVEFTTPVAQPDFGDYQVRLTATAPLFAHNAWKLAARLGPTLRGADSALANMTSLGVDARLTGGWYHRHGFVAAQLGVDWAAVTHVTNSDAYRKTTYADAKDGWYRANGGTLWAALLGGMSFNSWDVTLRVGVPRALDFAPQTVPFFALVGASYALPL